MEDVIVWEIILRPVALTLQVLLPPLELTEDVWILDVVGHWIYHRVVARLSIDVEVVIIAT